MSTVRFYADPHFGHEWTAKHRGFQDTFYHDEHLIDVWNSTVHKKDTIYMLGDITLESSKPYHLLDRLLGRKILIPGNHDLRQNMDKLLSHMDGISGPIMYKKYFLSHIPIHPRELLFKAKGNIHGHIHEHNIDDHRYICVSAESINYKPITLEQVEEIFNKYKLT